LEEKESYLLITRYLSNQTTTEENEFLADWIAKSVENEQIFEDIKIVWKASKPSENLPVTDALLKLKVKIREDETNKIVKLPVTRKWYFVAASIVSFIVISGIFYKYNYTKPAVSKYIVQTTIAGQKQTVILEDGTKVILAPQSSLKYPEKFGMDKRFVELQGEAYFEVSKNPNKPFMVSTSKLNIQVLGTHFNVNSYKSQNSSTVSLLEGKVKISLTGDDPEEYILKPGQELSVNHLNNQIYQHPLDSNSVVGWITNTMVFKNIKLIDAAKKIELIYGIRVVFADQATSDVRLYATFKDDSLTKVLETIKAAGNIDYNIENNKVYMTIKRQDKNR